MSDLTDISNQYYAETDIKYRKLHGQYFTPESLKRVALDFITIKNGSKILENSCGSGEFIKSILERNKNVTIDAYDIDQKLVSLVKKNYPMVNCFCEDYLLKQHKPMYNYIIGNPPYFQMRMKQLKEKGYDIFSDVCRGKPNIYSMFIKASIDSLLPNGELLFVVPTSMNNGADFKKLRNYIIETCDIENIKICGSKDFDSALQNVMILHLRKLKNLETNNGNYIFNKSDITIFSEDVSALQKPFDTGKTLHELGFNVMTGNLVWNQNKNYMSRNKNDTRLIWACNIINNSLVYDIDKLNCEDPEGLNEQAKYQKGQYVKQARDIFQMGDDYFWHNAKLDINIKPLLGSCIVVNRVTGAGKNATIRAAMLETTGQYFIENHLNYIVKTSTAVCELSDIYNALIKPETSQFIKNLTGNTQISKNELLHLIPFNI